MLAEEPAQMSGGHSERIREVLDAPAVVEEPALDEPQGTRNRGRRAQPRGCPRRGLGSTAQAGAETRSLGGSCGGEEDHVARAGRLDGAGGTAIDARGQHAGEEPPVESTIAGEARAIARLRIQR